MIKFDRENPTKKQKFLSERFQIKQSTLATIIENKSKIIEDYEASSSALKTKRARCSVYEEVDKALLLCFRQKCGTNLALDGDMLKTKAT
jgi:predicted transcriptional regulator